MNKFIGILLWNRRIMLMLAVPIIFYSMISDPVKPRQTVLSTDLEIKYPNNGTIFPPEMPAPLFQWEDSLQQENNYYISLTSENGKDVISKTISGFTWRPDSLAWEKIKNSSSNEKVIFSVKKIYNASKISKPVKKNIYFSFSEDSVGASIFYRAVPLPFGYAIKNVNQIEWYLGDVKGGKPRKILDNMPVCANCHSFSKDGSKFAMDVDYANDKGSYVISAVEDTIKLTLENIMTWSDYKREDGINTFGLLSNISPEGHHVLSTIKDRSIFVPVDNLEYSQLFFPIKGIIAVYDRDSRNIYELPGANDPSYVQSNPNWSPDGKQIMFTRASRYISNSIDKSQEVVVKPEDASEFIIGHKPFKFDLYQLDFNNGKGGVPQAVPGASGNTKSNYFARYSPDGKWVIFCQAENYMLLQPDSKLYIMPAQGGVPREMTCNTNRMNSWHSWSPNSKWLVFSSKNNGPYTQLYLTHIDENGNDSPAVLLENLVFDKKAANIPEFFNNQKNPLLKIEDAFSKSVIYYLRLATNNMIENDYRSAFNNLALAIQSDDCYFDAYMSRIMLNIHLGNIYTQQFNDDRRKAAAIINQQIFEKPSDQILLLKRANLYYFNNVDNEAINDAKEVIQLNPSNFDAYFLLASIYRKKGEMEKTLEIYQKMLQLRPDDKKITLYLGNLYQKMGKTELALNVYDKLISKFPEDHGTYLTRGTLRQSKGDLTGTKSDFDMAIKLKPGSYEAYQKRALYYFMKGQNTQGKADLDLAIHLLETDIKSNPQQIDLILRHAEFEEQIGNIKISLEDVDNVLKTWPNNYNALKMKGRLVHMNQQWKNSIEIHSRLIEHFAKEPDFFAKRGFAYLQSGEKDKAISDMTLAQSLSPNDYSILFNLALMKKTIGDKEGSNRDFLKIQKALTDNQKNGKLNEKESKMLYLVTEKMKEN